MTMPLLFEVHHRVLHIIYRTIHDITSTIYAIANTYEGFIPGRIGFNFPMRLVRKLHPTSDMAQYDADYVIVYKKGDIATKRHEVQHAKYDMDPVYKKDVQTLWDSFSTEMQEKVRSTLRRMNYPVDPMSERPSVLSERPSVHSLLLDEFQAYYFTEKKNFFES
jgi:hypothetical protein